MALPSTVQHLELEPRAADFLDLLRDLGHLDPVAAEKLSAELVSQARPDKIVRLEDVRRAAAVLLFESEATLRPDARELLAAEWGRLFY